MRQNLIQAIAPISVSSCADPLLNDAETEFQNAMHANSEHPAIVNQGNHCWSVGGNSSFIAKMYEKFKTVSNEQKLLDGKNNPPSCSVS